MRTTTIEGQNAFAPSMCFAEVSRYRWSQHVIWITSEWRSKRAWSNCVLCIPFILRVVQTNAGYTHECVTNMDVKDVTWRHTSRTKDVWGRLSYSAKVRAGAKTNKKKMEGGGEKRKRRNPTILENAPWYFTVLFICKLTARQDR